LATPFPHPGYRFSQFLVGDVQISLRGPHVGLSEHQLDVADGDAVRQEATNAFMTQVVPTQVDHEQDGGGLLPHAWDSVHAVSAVPQE